MKEEALEDFDAPLSEYDHTDVLPPENTVCIVLHAAPGAPPDKLRRSSVMWSLKALA
ncbi:MAG: hypothetical protein Q9211_003112, partial [Gyalolechia sp. 1 TL-2023]